MTAFTLKGVLEMVSGMIPEIQVFIRAGRSTTLFDVELHKLWSMRDPFLAERHAQELENLSRSLKEFCTRKKITWTVPSLPKNPDQEFRKRVVANLLGYFSLYLQMVARDLADRITRAEFAAHRHTNGAQPPPP